MRVIFFLLLIGIISISLLDSQKAESTSYFRGPDYSVEQIDNNTYKRTFGLDPFILNSTSGKYVPYIHNSTNLETSTAHGSVKLNNDCSFSFYPKGVIDENSTALFTDKIIAKYADVSDLNSWTYPNNLNNALCISSFEDGSYTASKTKSGIGLLDYKYIQSNGKWKTQLEATNLSISNTKAFGFDQIIDLNRDTIKYGGVQRNLDNFDGFVFDRNWLENNDSKVIDLLNGINFDFDLGFENLHSVTVYDTGPNSSRLVFDYRTSDPLLSGNTLVIDPNFGEIPFTYARISDQSGVATTTCPASSFVKSTSLTPELWLRNSGDSGVPTCRALAVQFDISNIPLIADVTDSILTADVDAVTNPANIDITPMTVDLSTASNEDIWNDILDGTEHVDNDGTFNTVGNDKTIDLTASFDADIESNLGGVVVFGIKYHDMTRGGSDVDLQLSDLGLTVTYDMPSDPPKQVESIVNATGVYLEWDQAETNGGTFSNYNVTRLNLDGVTWDNISNPVGTSYNDLQPNENATAKYRIYQEDTLGQSPCYGFPMTNAMEGGMVSHWPFCWTLNDQGFQDNDGTVTGDELYELTSEKTYLNSDDASYVVIPNESDYDYDITDDFSICFEIETTATGVNQGVVFKSDTTGANPGIKLYLHSSGTVTFRLSSNEVVNIASNAVNDGTPHHICVIYDGTSNRSGMSIYQNNVLVATGGDAALTGSMLNNHSLVIGAESDGQNPLDARYRNVMIFNYDLTASNVDILYNEHINTGSLAVLPDGVTDLTASPTDFISVNLAWTKPYTFTSITGYMINYTTPLGDPLTIITSDTGSPTTTTYEVTGLVAGDPNSFRVSPVTVYGTNSSGNIANATSFSNFDIGEINLPDGDNPSQIPILFDLYTVDSDTKDLQVTFDSTYDLSCNFAYTFAGTNQTYSSLSETVISGTSVYHNFTVNDNDNDIIDIYCWDTNDNSTNGSYLIVQDTVPIFDQIDLFQDGTFGTFANFGAIDLVTLFIVIISMIGFNRKNPAAGVIIMVTGISVAGYYEIIELPTIVLGFIALVVTLAIGTVRKS